MAAKPAMSMKDAFAAAKTAAAPPDPDEGAPGDDTEVMTCPQCGFSGPESVFEAPPAGAMPPGAAGAMPPMGAGAGLPPMKPPGAM